MTIKKKHSRAAATEPTAKTRRTKVAHGDTAQVESSPRTEPGVAKAAQASSSWTPEMAAGGPPLVNETAAAAQTEVLVETAATTPAPSPEQSVSPANKLSALDAAAKVLGETGQAMSCAEMIAAMAAKGYWSSPKGRTPAGTLYSGILRELQTKGEKARFCKSERGKFRLNRSLS
jgi:hypothetical protein